MPVVGPGAAAGANNHQRSPDGPAHPSRHGYWQEHVPIHRPIAWRRFRVRLTHQWVERSASRPPAPHNEPIFPPHGGETDGTDFAFQWASAIDPDGDAIADYQFELSDQADMKWPLSMSFAKLTSRTADAGQVRYTLPGPGLLNPDRRYFWRVRAQDNKGVWGNWSDTWSFVPRGPAPPIDLTLEFDPAHTSRRPALVTQLQRSPARWLPYLCQRRKGILDQR